MTERAKLLTELHTHLRNENYVYAKVLVESMQADDMRAAMHDWPQFTATDRKRIAINWHLLNGGDEPFFGKANLEFRLSQLVRKSLL